MIVGFDGGRNGSKTFTQDYKWWFPSCLGTNRSFTLDKEFGEHDMTVTHKGNSYLIGNIAEVESLDGARNFLKSKANLDTLVFTLVGIHRVIKDGDDVELVVCHPITNHKGKDKEIIKSMLLGRHSIIVNGIPKTFNIDSASVTVEGACGIFAIKDLPQIAHGIDVGSATVNYSTWYKGNWIDKLSGTLSYGIENSRLPIDGFTRKLAMDFSRCIQETQGTVYVFGGAAQRICDHLSQYITNQQVVCAQDPLYTNARACYEIGVRLHERKKAIQTK